MSEKEKRRFSPPAVGGSALLVAFAVLCLTVFALLSLSTVRADARLSDISAQAAADYYAADCKAQEILACLRSGTPLPEGGPEITTESLEYPDHSESVYTYACAISEEQELQVEVRLTGSAYTVLRWQAVSTDGWTPEDDLNVWDGALS